MINGIFSDTVNASRRVSSTSASRDQFNNPIYGDPTTWPLIYTNIKVRLAWSGKQIRYSNTGELIYPSGTMYYSKFLTLKPEDRIITVVSPGIPTGIEYIIEAVYPSYILHGVVDHYEANVRLPI